MSTAFWRTLFFLLSDSIGAKINIENTNKTELEIKIAYLEDFLNKLQAIAVEQGEVVDTLKAENRVLKAKIKEILDNQEQDIPNRRPPHY